MKFCVPTAIDDGIDSVAYGHLSSAPYFIIYDTKSRELYSVRNDYAQIERGLNEVALLMIEHQITAILVGGMGDDSLKLFGNIGINVFRPTIFYRVYDLIKQLENGSLFELNTQATNKDLNYAHH